MNKFMQFIHDCQIVVAALIMFLAVLVYCMFHRYGSIKFSNGSCVIDHLTGRCYRANGELIKGK